MTRKEIKKTNKKKKMKKKKGVGRKERDQGGRRGVTNGDGGMKVGRGEGEEEAEASSTLLPLHICLSYLLPCISEEKFLRIVSDKHHPLRHS